MKESFYEDIANLPDNEGCAISPDFGDLCDDVSLLLEANSNPSGIMVALYVPRSVAETLAVEDGEAAQDMHVTLAYLPKIGEDQEKLDRMAKALAPVAASFSPIVGKVGGIGRFNPSRGSDGKQVYYASFDAPGLNPLVQAVHVALRDAGFDLASDHGFTPHITLKYLEQGEELPQDVKESEEFTVPDLSIASRSLDRKDIPFGGNAS